MRFLTEAGHKLFRYCTTSAEFQSTELTSLRLNTPSRSIFSPKPLPVGDGNCKSVATDCSSAPWPCEGPQFCGVPLSSFMCAE